MLWAYFFAYAIQHAVDKLHGLGRRELSRDFQRFVDDDGARRCRVSRNSATASRSTFRSTVAIRSIRQCCVCLPMRPSISSRRSVARRKRSSAKPRTSSSTLVRSFQNVVRTISGVCFPISAWKSICRTSSRDLRRVPKSVSRFSLLSYQFSVRLSLRLSTVYRRDAAEKNEESRARFSFIRSSNRFLLAA